MAAMSNLDESVVRRTLRQAISRRIFCEPRKGFVIAHTGASQHLAEKLSSAALVARNGIR